MSRSAAKCSAEVLCGTGLVPEVCDELLPPPHPATRSNADKRTPRAETLGVLLVVCMPIARELRPVDD